MEHYKFGKNWKRFIDTSYTKKRVEIAQKCMLDTLLRPNLDNQSILDIGCGSGIHSLAALRSGARFVTSMDYDLDSVRTAWQLWKAEGKPRNWKIIHGDVLDESFMSRFEDIDIVYSWGVLHHTGNMYKAIKNAALPLKKSHSGGVFFIALYSYNIYQSYLGKSPENWLEIKQKYNAAGYFRKRYMEYQHLYDTYFWNMDRWTEAPKYFVKMLKAARDYKKARGMDLMTDVRDWLGGWPMDFVHEEECVEFCDKKLDMRLARMLTGAGNTEFVFATKNGSTWLDPIFENRRKVLLHPPYELNDPMVWRASIPQFINECDTNEQPFKSSLLLWEDDKVLPGAHSAYDCMFNFGNGRYRHWDNNLYFTTSDNSNPNTNGRKYEITIDDGSVLTEMRNNMLLEQ